MKKYLILAFSCSLIAFTNQVHSQSIQSISQGFSVHAHGQFAMWNSNSFYLSDVPNEDPNGLGLGIELSYGFTSMISGYLAFGMVNFFNDDKWERYNTKLYRFGGQYNFGGTTSKLRPFLIVGGVYQNFNLNGGVIKMGTEILNDVERVSKGLAAEVGGGVKYHIIPEFALELSVSGQFGQYRSNFANGQDLGIDETVDTQHLFVRLGVGYYLY